MYLSILLTLPNVRYKYQYYSHFIDSKTDALRRTDDLKQLVQDHTTNQWQNWDKNPFFFCLLYHIHLFCKAPRFGFSYLLSYLQVII